jgi:hypothetical protein
VHGFFIYLHLESAIKGVVAYNTTPFFARLQKKQIAISPDEADLTLARLESILLKDFTNGRIITVSARRTV